MLWQKTETLYEEQAVSKSIFEMKFSSAKA
jgi:hypothetical protein